MHTFGVKTSDCSHISLSSILVHLVLQRLYSAGITCQISVFVVFLMGNVIDWRTAAGINTALPIFTVLYVLLVRRERTPCVVQVY